MLARHTLLVVLATGVLAGFLDECDFLGFSRGANGKDPFLHYSCPINEPPYVWCSKLMLNDCIVNDKGSLRGRERGNFGTTCDKCEYDNKTGELSCWCGDGEGSIHWNSVNLEDFVWLSGAKIGCYGMKSGSTCSS